MFDPLQLAFPENSPSKQFAPLVSIQLTNFLLSANILQYVSIATSQCVNATHVSGVHPSSPPQLQCEHTDILPSRNCFSLPKGFYGYRSTLCTVQACKAGQMCQDKKFPIEQCGMKTGRYIP